VGRPAPPPPAGRPALPRTGVVVGGRQLFLTLFDSREELEAAEPWFERMGDEIPESTCGRRVSLEYREVAGGAHMLA
jgi:hypothetical protein